MKKLFVLLVLLGAAVHVMGGALPVPPGKLKTSSTNKIEPIRSGDTLYVPVKIVAGDRTGNPFPTYASVLGAKDSVSADSHYVVAYAWLSVPMATTNLQHAGADEIYWSYAGVDSQTNSIIGREISVNVAPGGNLNIRENTGKGVFGLIINGKPTVDTLTNDTGRITTDRWTGVYIDPFDVASGVVPYVTVDTTRGVWVPAIDAPDDSMGMTKWSFWGKNNIYCGDTLQIVDAVSILNTDSVWIKPDSLIGPQVWKVDDGESPQVMSYNGAAAGLFRMLGDSAQLRFEGTAGAVYIKVGDSLYDTTKANFIPLYIAAPNSLNLQDVYIRADTTHFRGAVEIDSSATFHAGTAAAKFKVGLSTVTDNYVLAVDADGDSTYWKVDATTGTGLDSAMAVAMIAESLAAYFDTAQTVDTIISTGDVRYIQLDGDTVDYNMIFDWNSAVMMNIYQLFIGNFPLHADTSILTEGEAAAAYSTTGHGHSLSDSLAKVAGDVFTGDVVIAGAQGIFHNDSTNTDSAYVTKGYVDANDATGGASDTSLVVSLSGSDTIAVKWSANGDTLITVDSAGNRFITYHDGTQWVQDFGDGLTVVDSMRVNDYILFGDTSHAILLDSARVDSMINLTGRYAGGSGSTDSTRLGYGLKNLSQAQDTLAAPTDTIRVDTTTISTKSHAEAYADSVILGLIDSTTAGNGLIEDANALAVRPGWGIDTVGDLVTVDSTNDVYSQAYLDTALAARLTAETDPVWTSDSADYAMKSYLSGVIDTITTATIPVAEVAKNADVADTLVLGADTIAVLGSGLQVALGILSPAVGTKYLGLTGDTIYVKLNSIDSTVLTDNSVLAAEIATGAVTSAKILDGTIATVDFNSAAVAPKATIGTTAHAVPIGGVGTDMDGGIFIVDSGGQYSLRLHNNETPDDITYRIPNQTMLFQIMQAYIDSVTGVKIPVSDSTDGGAARAELADDVDTTDGGIATALGTRMPKIGGAFTGDVAGKFFDSDTTVGDSILATKHYVDNSGLTETKIGDWIDTTITDTIQYAKVADTARNIGAIGSMNVYGNIDLSGYVNTWNWKYDLDTHNIQWRMPMEPVYTLTDDAAADSFAIHVSVKYRGTGWGVDSMKYHMALTPYFNTGGATYENPTYLVSDHPTDTFKTPTGGRNPLFIPDSSYIDINGDTITAQFPGYFSDVHLTFTFEESLAVVYRGLNNGQYANPGKMPDTNFLFVTLSGDGVTWTIPQCIAMSQSKWIYTSGDPRVAMGFNYLSPTIEPWSNGKYRMWTHEGNTYYPDTTGSSAVDSLNTVMLWEAASIRGPWDTIGTVSMPTPNDSLDVAGTPDGEDSLDLWHGSFTPFGPDQIVYIGNLTGMGGSGGVPPKNTYHHKWAGRYNLMMALSNDGGETFTMVREPMFWEKGISTYWRDTVTYPDWWGAGSYQYRGSPVFVQKGENITLGYFGIGVDTNHIYYTEAQWDIPEREEKHHVLDPIFIHGNYADTSDLPNVQAKGPGFIASTLTPYLWVDSVTAASGTYLDTIVMQYVAPAYIRIDSLHYSITTTDTSNVKTWLIIGPTEPGINQDSGLGALTYTNTGIYAASQSIRYNVGAAKYKNTGAAARTGVAIPVDSQLVFRQGDRFFVWFYNVMDANEFVKCNQWQFFCTEITPPKKDYYGKRAR